MEKCVLYNEETIVLYMDSKIKLLISKYVKASLSDAEAASLSAWLSEDKANRSEFRREIKNLSRENLTTSDAVLFWTDFEKNNNRLLAGSRRFSSGPVIWISSLVAAACFAAFLILGKNDELYTEELSDSIEELVEQRPSAQIHEEVFVADSISQILLADGTKVILNRGARLELSSSFNIGMREVNLEGEAFFDVAKDATRLFVVNCGKGTFIVRGTSFNISSYSDEKMSMVTLHSGALEARIQGNIIKLTPGDELMVDEAAQNYSKRAVGNVNDSKSWIESDKIVFNDMPLKFVAVKIARKYGIKLIVDLSIENMIYTGQINDEPLEQILRLLEVTSYVPVRITHEDNAYYIRKI